MGTIYVRNYRKSDIYVRITKNTNKDGCEDFCVVEAGKTKHWGRDGWEVAFIEKTDREPPEVLIVKAGETYDIN